MLELRPNCECCNKDLPPEAADAMICSFECTFCRDCAETTLGGRGDETGGVTTTRAGLNPLAEFRGPPQSTTAVRPHRYSSRRLSSAG